MIQLQFANAHKLTESVILEGRIQAGELKSQDLVLGMIQNLRKQQINLATVSEAEALGAIQTAVAFHQKYVDAITRTKQEHLVYGFPDGTVKIETRGKYLYGKAWHEHNSGFITGPSSAPKTFDLEKLYAVSLERADWQREFDSDFAKLDADARAFAEFPAAWVYVNLAHTLQVRWSQLTPAHKNFMVDKFSKYLEKFHKNGNQLVLKFLPGRSFLNILSGRR